MTLLTLCNHANGGHRRRGQTIPIIALVLLVLVAFAGLAIDGVHVYLVKRQAQNAADAAALAAGKQLVANGVVTGPPGSSGAPSVTAAHELASVNGFATLLSSGCDSATGSQFSAIWFDASAACGSNTLLTRVIVHTPPIGPMPPDCQAIPFNCFQVVVTKQVSNYLMGILGIPTTYVTATATVLAQPAGPLIGTPPPTAVYLYEPTKAACSGGQSCFDQGNPPQRSQLSCGNCPTFWVRDAAGPVLGGIDGKLMLSKSDQPVVQSNGDMLLQDDTTICDPYGGATCTAGTATGSDGFGIASGSTLYCAGFAGGGTANGLTGCTATGQSSLNHMISKEVPFTNELWAPTVSTAGLANCGTLVLNGGTVASSGVAAACYPPSDEPYTIMAGVYQSIVINHGTYEFEHGLYDIIGVASDKSISHGNETAGADYDLCPGITNGDCKAKAGVWIGHGNNPYVAASSSKLSCLGQGSQGGGGDQTIVDGNGVTFLFGSNSAGFVSTHEVQQIALTSPALGAQLSYMPGTPLLFDMENNGMIHLDSMPPNKSYISNFTGIVYQTNQATAGGVEINPGLAGNVGALNGQVLAYSFTTFGQKGTAIDFSQGYGTSSSPPITTSGHNETSIVSPAPILKDLGNGVGQLVIGYTDEWAVDAYDAYVKINGGNAIFFSQGIWTTTTDTPPPTTNIPGDSNPARPDPTLPAAANYAKTTTNGLPDWTYTYADGSKFEVSGNWTWGHEADLGSTTVSTNRANLTYTFNAPPGQTIEVLIFMTDGDHCGDYASADLTFNNVGTPQAGQQGSGSVLLID